MMVVIAIFLKFQYRQLRSTNENKVKIEIANHICSLQIQKTQNAVMANRRHSRSTNSDQTHSLLTENENFKKENKLLKASLASL